MSSEDRKGQKNKAQSATKILEQKARSEPAALFHLATVYADLGESNKAFECLQKAYQKRDARLVWIKLEPRLDSLRSDPRFDELLRKMNLAR